MCGWEPLACGGVRPDNPDAKQIIPLDSLRGATDEKRASERFRPGKALAATAIGSGRFPADTGCAMMPESP